MTKKKWPQRIRQISASITALGFVGLSTVQPLAGGDLLRFEQADRQQTVGLSFSGTLDFSRCQLNAFSAQSLDGIGPHVNNGNGLVRARDGRVQVDLPLLTYGEDIVYPGIFYNHHGEQFYRQVLNSYEGYEDTETNYWPYIIGGVVIVGGAVALAVAISDSDDDSKNNDPQATTTSSTTSTTTSGSRTTTTTTLPSDEEADTIAKDLSSELENHDVSQEDIDYYLDQYKSLSDEEKQALADEYGPIVEDYLSQL